MNKTAFITGVSGQDGAWLSRLLLSKGYIVHGLLRRSSNLERPNIEEIRNNKNFILHYGDITDIASIINIVSNIENLDEVYNLAAQSFVKASFDVPIATFDSIALGTLNMLEVVKNHKNKPRFYQASSSEMFGNSPPPQNELTILKPRSPYGCSKLYAHQQTINYRESYGIHASCGILFNHESIFRGENFVTRKITKAAARIFLGLQATLELGNLDARRDWGFAGDYVRAMWMMLQQEEPDDYVIATGETYSIRELLDVAFGHLGLDWEKYVEINPIYYRAAEVDVLLGDASKAKVQLGWEPQISFRELIIMMVDHDLNQLRS
jgi:GDPmannose 4,6-dehydratase